MINEAIEVYSSSGQLINSIPCNGIIREIKWSDNDELCVLLKGKIRWYSIDGEFDEFNIDADHLLVIPLGTLIISDGKLIQMDRQGDMKHIMEINGQFYDWCVINETIYIAFNSGVYRLSDGLQTMSLDGPFYFIRTSYNKKLLSLYNEKGVSIVSSDFKVLLQYDCARPKKMEWCGSDAVLLLFEDSLKLIAPGGELDIFIDDQCIISPEMEGLTILSSSSLQYLAKVDDSTVDVFKIGSRSKSAILMDAIDKLTRHSPKVNENLTIIGNGLFDAVKQCLEASKHEFDPYWQKKLLKAVSFGNVELQLRSEKSVEFVTVLDELRILNIVRNDGLFLTYEEFKSIGIIRFLELLTKRQRFKQCYQISKFIKFPLDIVFIEWACHKIRYSQLNDEQLSQKIIMRFQSMEGNKYISFEHIARCAYREGRLNLTKILINFESSFKKQIDLLFSMEENELALQKGIDSLDIDLLLCTLLKLKQRLSYAQFYKLLNNHKFASNVWEYFQLDESMTDYYNQADRLIDLANYKMKTMEYSAESIQMAIETYKLRYPTMVKSLERQSTLMKIQDDLTDELNIEFNGMSLTQTVQELLRLSQHHKVQRLVKQFKINERKFAFMKMKYYIDSQRWDELYDWAKSKPLPIEIIVEKCLMEKRLALKMIETLNVPYDAKVDLLIKLKEFGMAIDEAIKKKDLALIDQVEELNTDQELLSTIEEARTKIGTSRFF
jgi:hypothetical protein